MEDALADIKDVLKKRIGGLYKEKVVFVGVGNRMRGDDAIGPALIDMISDNVPHAIDAENVPENFTGRIKRIDPQAIVFIDAVHFGNFPAGYTKIVEISEAGGYGLTTHKFSLDMVMEYLKEETGADVFMIGVQPATISDTEGISPVIEDRLKAISRSISTIFNNDLSL
ncbi:hydrogenase 3 maturation endopeptidase HyCI [Methanocella sp. CWC-04]|uniref:Hydrogenase 3 maturation endopeptidase HyCI n=1 Tax=Methanooceanicella nereidis TaxID=2052831 RepID=A0AAP2W6N8_9EURY|nr:hydrogenase 3 maturation endopeptidase HyCI [Methanocella sp. CWC-04]MCD1294464.1 hydrogenase 3 maturation endopeptidase HyCI [Methanocella sp. CWC-04]